MCAVGLYGYQYVTTINCSENSTYQMSGINNFGELNLINIFGNDITFTVNNSNHISNDQISNIGDYVWFSQGLRLDITVSGSVYLFGANTTLTPITNTDGIKAAKHVYDTIPYRVYRVLDGVFAHDPHINNGSSYAFDMFCFRRRPTSTLHTYL